MEKNIRMIFKINVNDNSEICWISIYIYIKKKIHAHIFNPFIIYNILIFFFSFLFDFFFCYEIPVVTKS